MEDQGTDGQKSVHEANQVGSNEILVCMLVKF